jgi:hypothetical protein
MRNAIACSLALAAVVLPGPSAQAQLPQKKALSLEAARKMVAAAEAEAGAITGAVSSRSSTKAVGSFCSNAWIMPR